MFSERFSAVLRSVFLTQLSKTQNGQNEHFMLTLGKKKKECECLHLIEFESSKLLVSVPDIYRKSKKVMAATSTPLKTFD